jgi:hypothetical protein
MIPRGKGLVDGRGSISVQAGEENRSLHLRAGNVRSELNRLNGGRALNRHRRTALIGANPGTHSLEWDDHASHRSTPQRVVAGHRGLEGVGRENPGEHPHGAARIPRVEHSTGRGQAAEPAAGHCQGQTARIVSALVDGNAEGAKTAHCGRAVAAGGVAPDFGPAIGQGGQKRVAV